MPASDQGNLQGRYTLIPRTLIFVLRGEEVLLLKGAPHKKLWANRYNGVGGHVERGEDVLSAARRELQEETGLLLPGLYLCGVITIDTGSESGIAIYVFCARLGGARIGDIQANEGMSNAVELTASTEGSLEWVPVNRLTALPLVEDLPVLLPHVLAMQPGAPPFAALYRYDPDGKLQISFG